MIIYDFFVAFYAPEKRIPYLYEPQFSIWGRIKVLKSKFQNFNNFCTTINIGVGSNKPICSTHIIFWTLIIRISASKF
jgi:hypothetical protein